MRLTTLLVHIFSHHLGIIPMFQFNLQSPLSLMGGKIRRLVSHQLHSQVMQLQHHYWHLQAVGAKLAAHPIVTVNTMIATTQTQRSREKYLLLPEVLDDDDEE